MKKLLLIIILFMVGFLLYPLKNLSTLKNGYAYYDSKQSSFRVTQNKPKDWVYLNQVSEYALNAFVLSEDWSFFEHHGVDFKQLENAIREYMKGTRVRGASTITQQVVKNLFLSSEKTFFRKSQEILLSLILERIISKEKILEIYVNIIHLGKNLFGIKKGAQYYFGKHPGYLNAKEGAFLAMLLPNPLKNNTSFLIKKLTPYGRKIIEDILWKLKVSKNISKKRYKQELAQKIEFKGTLEGSKTF